MSLTVDTYPVKCVQTEYPMSQEIQISNSVSVFIADKVKEGDEFNFEVLGSE